MAVKHSPFEINDVRFRTLRANKPDEVSARTYEKLRNLLIETLVSGGFPHRNGQQIEKMLGSADHFVKVRRNPALAFSERPQRFGTPRLTVAEVLRDGAYDQVGYILTANNSSGSPLISAVKMAVPPVFPIPKLGGKRHVHVREIAVAPSYQHRGIGTALLYYSLKPYQPQQPLSTYYHPGEQPLMQASLNELEFHEKPEDVESVDLFRTGIADINRAHSVGTVLSTRTAILELPGAAEALLSAAA